MEEYIAGLVKDGRIRFVPKSWENTYFHWMRNVRGRVIKVVSSLIQYLPDDNYYKVVFLRRDLSEVLASQAKMLVRRGEENTADDGDMLRMYESHLDKVKFQLRFRDWFDVLYLDFSDVVADPEKAAKQINDFLGGHMDVEKMAVQVDPNLYRNRAES